MKGTEARKRGLPFQGKKEERSITETNGPGPDDGAGEGISTGAGLQSEERTKDIRA